ncbi:TonB-dependent receptor domain-containing protein [Sphingomonas sp. MMS24-JH45]
MTLTLGGRVDRWRIAGRFPAPNTHRGWRGADRRRLRRSRGQRMDRARRAAFSPVTAVTLRGSAYRGWRLPTLNELYRPFRVGADATAANAALVPERLVGVDGGVTLTPARGLSLAATVFWNRLDDAIANVTAGVDPPRRGLRGGGRHVSRARQPRCDPLAGMEIDARWDRGALFAQGSWSHVDPARRGIRQRS